MGKLDYLVCLGVGAFWGCGVAKGIEVALQFSQNYDSLDKVCLSVVGGTVFGLATTFGAYSLMNNMFYDGERI
jgi:hypothetical protein